MAQGAVFQALPPVIRGAAMPLRQLQSFASWDFFRRWLPCLRNVHFLVLTQ